MDEEHSDGYVAGLSRICQELVAKKSELESVAQYFPYLREVHAHLVRIREELLARDTEAATIPPDQQVHELRFFGWALFESALVAINRVETAYEYLPESDRARSKELVREIAVLANLARATPWPEFSVRGLGALRSLALAHSKGDSPDEYRAAWTVHAEVEEALDDRADQIESGLLDATPHIVDLKRDLAEMWQQHDLSQTGTSCREPEFTLCRWIERVKKGDIREDGQPQLIAFLAQRLRTGIRDGVSTITRSDDAFEKYEIFDYKTEKHLLQRTSMQNPGIMAARAYLLLIPMCPLMESYDHPPFDGNSWEEYCQQLIKGFVWAYGRIETPPGDGRGSHEIPKFVTAHLRSLVQHRLFFRIICPNEPLPTKLDEHILGGTLDLDDVDQMSEWLRTRGDDANVISSATMPEYIRGIEATRAKSGVDDGYREWRREWPTLDRFHREPGRADLVAEVLGTARA